MVKCHLGLIHRQFHDADTQFRVQVYKSLVLPMLEYCFSVWDPHQAYLTNKLECCAARVVTHRWMDSPLSTFCSPLDALPSKRDRQNRKLVLLSHFRWPHDNSKIIFHSTPFARPQTPMLFFYLYPISTTLYLCTHSTFLLYLWYAFPVLVAVLSCLHACSFHPCVSYVPVYLILCCLVPGVASTISLWLLWLVHTYSWCVKFA